MALYVSRLTSLIQSSAWRRDLHVIWTLSPIFFMIGRSNDIASRSPGLETHTMANTCKITASSFIASHNDKFTAVIMRL